MGLRRGPGRIRSGLVVLVLLGGGVLEISQGAWIHAKAALAQYLLHRAWDESRLRQRYVKPWAWADTAPIARLVVPNHDIDQIVLSGASGRTLAFGPAHHDGTAAPGTSGTMLLAGHRDTHFRFLEKLQRGDEVQIHDRQGWMVRYAVTGTTVVDNREAFYVPSTSSRALILMTCYPFDALVPGGPLRYVVLAEALPPAGDAQEAGGLKISGPSADTRHGGASMNAGKPATARLRISNDPMYQLLRDGAIKEFNAKKAAGQTCDLRGCDLRSLDLRGLDAAGLDFSDSYFRQADLRGVDFREARLEGASINNAQVSGAFFPAELSPSEILLSLQHGTRMRYSR